MIKKWVPWLVAIAFFMEALDATILNTAIPVISTALQVVPLSMKSVLSSYTLSLAVFIPISSWVADRFGTRRVFATAIGVFTLGSLLCGMATSIQALVIFRILQGCGGALMVPVGRLTLVRTFPKSELVRAMSFVAIPALIGPMLGPLVGGLIVGYFHWRMIFFVNLPIGILGLFTVLKFLPDYKSDHKEPLDLLGLILFGCGIALLSYVLEIFGEHSLSGTEIAGLLAVALCLLAGYALHARPLKYPLLHLNLLRLRTFRASIGGNFFTRLGAGGLPFLLPLLYQVGLGFSPVQSGLLILPQSVASLVFRFSIPSLLAFFGYRKLLLFNTIFMGTIMMFFATVDHHTSVALIILQASGFGFFSSLQYTSMNTLAYAQITPKETSHASTILSTVQQMSLSFGVATSSLITTYFIHDRFHASPEELIHGLHRGFIVLGSVTILSAIGFMELKGTDGSILSHHEKSAADDKMTEQIQS